jgi:hypothetical protein
MISGRGVIFPERGGVKAVSILARMVQDNQPCQVNQPRLC